MSESNQPRPLRVVISGGGTGGHIFPALAIAGELRRRDPRTEILFVGAEGRMEMERVPAAGYDIVGLPVMGFDRKRLWRNFKVLWKLQQSVRRANKVLRKFRPDIAVGVGGYASGPTLKKAQQMGIPTLIQEQNSYPGVTNKMLAPKAEAICVAYPGLERFFPADKIILTGNPVRAAILNSPLTQAQAKVQLGFDPARPLVLVVGGSLGARTINQAVTAALLRWADADISLLWQTGKFYADECAKAAEGHNNVRATAFIDDMATAYRAADLVVSRAGASTISELQLLGAATVLVPSPNVAEDHQTKNAMALVDRGAAVMVRDAEAVDNLAQTVTTLVADAQRLYDMRANIATMALPDAAAHIVDHIYQITGSKPLNH